MVNTLFTLCLYGAVYLTAYFLFRIANNVQSLWGKKILLALGIVILALFGCMRDFEVGTDTLDTIKMYFEDSKRYHSFGAMFTRGISSSTLIFLIISKILIYLKLGARPFLFIMHILTLAPVTAVAYIRREKTSISLTMAIYMALYYQLSFNWIRQSIATTLLLLGLVLFLNHKKIGALIAVILSELFHASALLGVVLFAVAWFTCKTKNKYLRRALIASAFLVTFVAMVSWQPLALWAIQHGVLPESYMGYISVFSGGHGSSYKGWFLLGKKTYVEYFLRFVMFIFPGYILNYQSKKVRNGNLNQELYFFRTCMLLSFLIYSASFLGLHTAYANRVTYYLDIANVIYLGLCCKPKHNNGKYSLSFTFNELIVILMVLTYNIWLYYIMGWHETVPFKFGIF